ncbi:MAG: hypothetical protein U0354_20130 [Candidatus Sericytochromatia bacterium]
MNLKLYSKTTANIVLALLFFSCSKEVPNTLKTEPKKETSFNSKFQKDVVEDSYNYITYQPLWTQEYSNDASGYSYSYSSLLENDSTSLVYQPNWNVINDINASGGSYSLISGQVGSALLTDNDPNSQGLKYNDSLTKWVHHITNPDSISYNENEPLIINSKSNSAKKYGSGWKEKDNDKDCSYNSNHNGTYIEISFTGTNIELWGNQDKDYGKVKVTIFDSNNNIEKVIDNIDRYNTKEKKTLIAKIQGLKNGVHRARIESTKTKNPLSRGYGYDFSQGIIYPSFEYIFTGTEIKYFAFIANTYGKVDVILDGGTPERFDLYGANTPKYLGCSLSKDHDNGHGNDEGDCDSSNPGKSKPDCPRDDKKFNSKSNDKDKKEDDDKKPKVCIETENQVTPVSKLIKEYTNLSNIEHRITVEGTNEKNSLSRGYTINFDRYEKNSLPSIPSVEGYFDLVKGYNNGGGGFNSASLKTKTIVIDPDPTPVVIENNLALKLVKAPNLGLVDLYIDDVFNQTIDLYNPTIKYETINVDMTNINTFSVKGIKTNDSEDEDLYHFGVNTLGAGTGYDCYDVYSCTPTITTHKFKLVAKNEKNSLSSGMGITFDSADFSHARYSFIGTGLDYIATKKSDQGLVDLYLDGKLYKTIDLYSSESKYMQVVESIRGLEPKEHIIHLKPSGKKNSLSSGYQVNVDSFKVYVSTQLKGQVGKD